VFGPKGHPVSVAWAVEAHHNPPQGVRGGRSGSGADAWMLDDEGRRVSVDLVGSVDLQRGQRIVSISSGGGGYGSPLDRDPALVLDDVLEGWVSRERAREVYGVELIEGADGQLSAVRTDSAQQIR
jgi:N-methylhydantoinase B